MLEEVVVSTLSANLVERIEECYSDRETGDDFQYFYYEYNLEFFSDFLKLFDECLFRNPRAVPGAVVGLGLARCQAALVARGVDALVYLGDDVGRLVCRDVLVLEGHVCGLTELDVFEREGAAHLLPPSLYGSLVPRRWAVCSL